MSDDLISRSALMQSLRGNVLVDVTPNLEQAIKEQPTAYDVDKVMEQLEEHKKNIINRKERDILNTVGKTNAKAAVERDIEIVKSGGIE